MDDSTRSYIAGMFGGASGAFACHPLDTIKSRIQSQGSLDIPFRYNGTIDAFLSICKNEGVRGFYKGVVPPFFGQGCINAITFGVEDNVAKYVTSKKDNVYFKHLKTGMTAGFVQVFVCTPMELVKLHTQHQKIGEVGRYQGNWATLMKILRAEGITGCYRGLFVTAVRDVSGFGVYFAAYEGLMDSFARMQGKHRDELGFVPQFLLGGTAGVASWLCNYPVELIKTRFQMDGFIGERQYKSSFDVLLKELRQGGKLFRGIVPCLHRAFLFNSFTFPVVEFVKGWKSKKIE